MAGWHHRLDGHESERTPGVGDGQGGLACCDSCGRKESDTTEQLTPSFIFKDILFNIKDKPSVSSVQSLSRVQLFATP